MKYFEVSLAFEARNEHIAWEPARPVEDADRDEATAATTNVCVGGQSKREPWKAGALARLGWAPRRARSSRP